ncbi:hypothetical protein HAX54_023073 [Datura stramonium]|uniref:Uncharacterized protein n=1 Tax=Datura stramonium TaxID=4076 RepID=A0ABS8UXG8_DATST|nr:hypothetical protein [Datura stramonium]
MIDEAILNISFYISFTGEAVSFYLVDVGARTICPFGVVTIDDSEDKDDEAGSLESSNGDGGDVASDNNGE